MTEIIDYGTRDIDPKCEICGKLALVEVIEAIDITEDSDKFRRFVPGKVHRYCLEHEPKAQA